ncbi:hypothetical protein YASMINEVIRUS_874, partial [Yasminevirus sp. GU-2018]
VDTKAVIKVDTRVVTRVDTVADTVAETADTPGRTRTMDRMDMGRTGTTAHRAQVLSKHPSTFTSLSRPQDSALTPARVMDQVMVRVLDPVTLVAVSMVGANTVVVDTMVVDTVGMAGTDMVDITLLNSMVDMVDVRPVLGREEPLSSLLQN